MYSQALKKPIQGKKFTSLYDRVLKEGFFLRFKEAALEKMYCSQIIAQKTNQIHALIVTIFASCLLFSIIDFVTLPEDVALSIALTRMPPIFLCTAAWLVFQATSKDAELLLMVLTICLTVGGVAIMIPQWIAYPYGIERPYVALLLVVLYIQIMSPLPWRIGFIPTIASALALGGSEWLFQPDRNLLNLHLTYIGTAAICALYSSYIYERIARLNFLSNGSLQELGRHDSLTRLPNRREMDEHLERLLRQAAREKTAVTLAMIDIDHFKAYNDFYGHIEGDHTLQRVAHAIQTEASLRPDFVARYGGEEFIAVWFNPQADETRLGNSLRHAVTRIALPHQQSPEGYVSISVGVSCQFPTSKSEIDQWLLSADSALYRAKESGRNCVRIDNSPLPLKANTDERPHSERKMPWLGVAANDRAEKPDPARFRGIHERRQIEGMAVLGVAITISLMVVNYYSLPAEIVDMLVWKVQGSILLPVFLSGYLFSQQAWLLRQTHILVPIFCLVTGMSYNILFYYAQSRGIFISCEIILIVLFLVYAVGGQSWQNAALSSLAISIVFIWVQLSYPPPSGLKHMLAAIFCVNLVGIISSRTYDKVALQTFTQREELESLATLDTLTELSNRHGLDNYFKHILSLQDVNRHEIAIAMVDVDHFKAYNDFYGHHAGDQVLARIAQELSEIATRPYDFVARYGGEEFVLVWYQPQQRSLKIMAERIRSRIAALNLRHEACPAGTVTISLGITQGAIKNGMASIEHLLYIADQALYSAKNKGRDRVEIVAAGELPLVNTSAPPD